MELPKFSNSGGMLHHGVSHASEQLYGVAVVSHVVLHHGVDVVCTNVACVVG